MQTTNAILQLMQRLASLKLTKHSFRDIDKVDDLMQDITEQRELAQEISDAISKPVGFGEEFDDVGASYFCFFALDFVWILSCLLDAWRLQSSTIAIVSSEQSSVSKQLVKILMKWLQV